MPLLHDFDRLADAVLPFTRKEAEVTEADKPPGRVLQFNRCGSESNRAVRFPTGPSKRPESVNANLTSPGTSED